MRFGIAALIVAHGTTGIANASVEVKMTLMTDTLNKLISRRSVDRSRNHRSDKADRQAGYRARQPAIPGKLPGYIAATAERRSHRVKNDLPWMRCHSGNELTDEIQAVLRCKRAPPE